MILRFAWAVRVVSFWNMAGLFRAKWNVTAIQMNIIQNSEFPTYIPQRLIIQGGITDSRRAPVKAIGKRAA